MLIILGARLLIFGAIVLPGARLLTGVRSPLDDCAHGDAAWRAARHRLLERTAENRSTVRVFGAAGSIARCQAAEAPAVALDRGHRAEALMRAGQPVTLTGFLVGAGAASAP